MSPSKKIKILITNITLGGYTGTETVVRDLALGFKKRGHYPMVYTPETGGISEEIIAAGIPVVKNLAELSEIPDIIHGHHHIQTIEAILCFPNVPAIFVCHSHNASFDIPPKLDAIGLYIAVDKFCQERLIRHGIPASNIKLIYNWIDTTRFEIKSIPSETPKKALVFSSYARRNKQLANIELACAKLNITVDALGFGLQNGSKNPENVIGGYDIIFAKAKCAIEAMGVGAALIVCDIFGLGSLVTTENVAQFREWNFGRKLLTKDVTPNNIIAEIKKYSSTDAQRVTKYIHEVATLENALDIYLCLYEELIQKSPHDSKIKSFLPTHFIKYASDLLQQANLLEKILDQNFVMARLPEDACKSLVLKNIFIPKKIHAGQPIQCKVMLKNYSKYCLRSCLPFPVHFGYHWLSMKDNSMYHFEGIRTVLPETIKPNSKNKLFVDVLAPEHEGEYNLIITLVQESYAWLYSINKTLYIKQHVQIIT